MMAVSVRSKILFECCYRQNFSRFGRHLNWYEILSRIKIVFACFVNDSKVLAFGSVFIVQHGINFTNLQRFRVAPVVNAQNI